MWFFACTMVRETHFSIHNMTKAGGNMVKPVQLLGHCGIQWIHLLNISTLHCVLHWCAMKNLHLRFISDLVVSKSEERRNHYYCSRARAATQLDQNHSSFAFWFLVLFTLLLHTFSTLQVFLYQIIDLFVN